MAAKQLAFDVAARTQLKQGVDASESGQGDSGSAEFPRLNTAILGISVDGAWCHMVYRKHNIAVPLLADFEPKGAVARRYGAYRHQDGVAERALFVDALESMRASKTESKVAV